jgi:hypothetical protein
MKIVRFTISGCVLAALSILPAASAAESRKCIVQKPTPASYAWNFRQEANATFKDIELDATQARYHADRLQSVVSRPDSVSWPSDATQLDQIRSAVNDMGQRLCRLETIRRVVDPWQQNTIDRIAVDVRLLADNTQDALAFGSSHRQTLWVPAFQRYVDNLYTEARMLTQAVGNAVEYPSVDRKDRVLQKGLNTRSSS